MVQRGPCGGKRVILHDTFHKYSGLTELVYTEQNTDITLYPPLQIKVCLVIFQQKGKIFTLEAETILLPKHYNQLCSTKITSDRY